MTSLADMPPAQRLESVGMWCDVDTEAEPAIIVRFVCGGVSQVVLFAPSISDLYTMESLNAVTPRYDLPRAWTPQGGPVPGEWVEETVEMPCTYGNEYIGAPATRRVYIMEGEMECN
ncbi:hypothetical protein [Corynebacterium ulcerans]|uniref:hypothetical protein n=1 Tax=Corynebacterium ulcerans TaxID=65058 RepID=UPI000C783499|nr:hypothetical protein [Corynebacterium ulcerans]PLW01178.1 hypothetical protein BRL54_11410 [Corynebacterium ulcerans]